MTNESLVANDSVAATELSDIDLIGMVAAEDSAGLGRLYDRHRSAAYGVALRITRDSSLAEDAVQNAFLGIWRNPRSYDASRGTVRTWLLAIVQNRSIDILRRRRAVSELPAEAVTPASLVQRDIWLDVAEILDRDAVAQALARLTDTQREAIEMAYFSGLTQVEIAQRTGAPLGTVKSRVRLGLLSLRSAITDDAARAASTLRGVSGSRETASPLPQVVYSRSV